MVNWGVKKDCLEKLLLWLDELLLQLKEPLLRPKEPLLQLKRLILWLERLLLRLARLLLCLERQVLWLVLWLEKQLLRLQVDAGSRRSQCYTWRSSCYGWRSREHHSIAGHGQGVVMTILSPTGGGAQTESSWSSSLSASLRLLSR